MIAFHKAMDRQAGFTYTVHITVYRKICIWFDLCHVSLPWKDSA